MNMPTTTTLTIATDAADLDAHRDRLLECDDPVPFVLTGSDPRLLMVLHEIVETWHGRVQPEA